MGYGGFIGSVFKAAVKIAAAAVGMAACGPPCAALGAAAATGATGGSFKEALIAGATTFIGSSVTQSLGSSLQSGLGESISAGDAFKVIDSATGAISVADAATGSIIATGAAATQAVSEAAAITAAGGLEAAIEAGTIEAPSMFDKALGATGISDASMTSITDVPLLDQIVSGPSKFLADTFGTVGGVTRTAFDFIKDNGRAVLGPGGLGFDVTPLAINTVGDLAAYGIGSLTTLTLEQALNADLPGLDEVLSQKFEPSQILALRNEARNTLSQQAFDRLISETTNPFLREEPPQTAEEEQAAIEEFNKIIASGIERENVLLGPDVTEAQFGQVFDNPDLGQTILGEEEALRREASGRLIGEAFPGDVFQTLDDDIINSIVQERRGPAGQQISAFEARGNLNPLGGQTANVFLAGQEPAARERVSEVGGGVLGTARSDIGDVRERAEQAAGGYTLGQDLFDVAPFSEERAGVIEERQGTLGEDVRTALGSEPLFNVTGALQTAGRTQGAVSGSPNQSFLDAIAAREQGALGGNRTRRGLGSRGSGVF